MSTWGNRGAAGRSAAMALSAFCALSLSHSPAAAQPNGNQVATGRDYSAAQWPTISTERKSGFVDGIVECQIQNLHKAMGFDAIEEVATAAMDEYAKVFATQYPTQSMEFAWDSMTTTTYAITKKDLIEYNSTEGYERWNGDTSPEYHRGFLEGHIACRERHGPLRWSKPIDYYLDKLDHIYDPDAKPYPADADRTISSLLTKLADPRRK